MFEAVGVVLFEADFSPCDAMWSVEERAREQRLAVAKVEESGCRLAVSVCFSGCYGGVLASLSKRETKTQMI